MDLGPGAYNVPNLNSIKSKDGVPAMQKGARVIDFTKWKTENRTLIVKGLGI